MSTDASTTTIPDAAETPPGTEAERVAGPVVDVTPAALAKVLSIRDEEDDPGSLGLRIEVTGTRGVDYTYDLAFEALAEVEEGDNLDDVGGLTVWVPAGSVDDLRGAVLDLPSSGGQAGLVIRNPNRPDPLKGVDLELTGTLAEKVQQLLDASINPSLASHGGFATLLGVEGDRVFITMGGGCQGCSMSAATLLHGIQVAIKDALPEVTEVVDATDHTAGENPFYT
jgi:Fe/S biogenesis protein NfuA